MSRLRRFGCTVAFAWIGLVSPIASHASAQQAADGPERNWPPVEHAAFRSELLSTLSRTAPDETRVPDLKDVTSFVLNNASVAPYCDMPAELRRKIKDLTITIASREYANEMMEALKRECNLRVFARQEAGGRIFVAVYVRGRAGVPRKTYTSRLDDNALAVMRTPADAPSEREVRDAAKLASIALKKR